MNNENHNLWHRRLGHFYHKDLSVDIIINFFKYLNDLFPNYTITNFKSDQGKEYCSRRVEESTNSVKRMVLENSILLRKIPNIMVLLNVLIKPLFIL